MDRILSALYAAMAEALCDLVAELNEQEAAA